MKSKLSLLIIILIISCNNETKNQELNSILNSHLEHSLISRGNNFPDFNPYKDNVDLFLISLHKGIPTNSFKNKVNWNDSILNKRIELLLEKNWVNKRNNKLYPSIFIASHIEGLQLYEFSNKVSEQIANSIEQEIPEIKTEYLKTDISNKLDFKEMSFLILSDVLLDSWQIENVERKFLKKKQRPFRNGKHYYYSIMENKNTSQDVFGIYGNMMDSNDTISYNIYGNRQTLVDFNKLDELIKNCDVVINEKDYDIFSDIANQYLPKLLSILENNQTYFEKVYTQMNYDKEITFDEFFIWWYHFIYTNTTNILNKRKLLTIPPNGNFEYISTK
ncbi:hypothetical protein EI427_21105 [Flammeovirga pectinis]|uniref:Uncharacterized protein n=1 Tax=Flammeovirga pectinis TaxID=2494373 RepID=A0A3Q9FS11_9BACT|nr:hypothetical protein [Flammeovirga pectinis]AZQ64725.1 hypothetical protein EI427_21105 [Flammeovirga pectinis]